MGKKKFKKILKELEGFDSELETLWETIYNILTTQRGLIENNHLQDENVSRILDKIEVLDDDVAEVMNDVVRLENQNSKEASMSRHPAFQDIKWLPKNRGEESQ